MPMVSKPAVLSPDFFAQPTVEVARLLLGQELWVQSQPIELSGPKHYWRYRIVETEAYTADDPACHAYGKCLESGKSRSRTLFLEPGLAYVYLIYGMYHCLNVVTEPYGIAGAVLFRGLEPLSAEIPQHTHGPGRLTKALNIAQAQNEQPMTTIGAPLLLVEGAYLPDASIRITTRIGIRKAADYPWRFYVKDSSFVSVKLKADQIPKQKYASKQKPA